MENPGFKLFPLHTAIFLPTELCSRDNITQFYKVEFGSTQILRVIHVYHIWSFNWL